MSAALFPQPLPVRLDALARAFARRRDLLRAFLPNAIGQALASRVQGKR